MLISYTEELPMYLFIVEKLDQICQCIESGLTDMQIAKMLHIEPEIVRDIRYGEYYKNKLYSEGWRNELATSFG